MCWNTSWGWLFPFLSHRWACHTNVSEIPTEEIPGENKSESAVQSTSSGCDQPGCAAPIHINMQCTGTCSLHSKASLTHPGCAGLAETLQRKADPPMPPIQPALKTKRLSCTHSKLSNTDLVSYVESNFTSHLGMPSGQFPRLPEVTTDSLSYCFHWPEIQKFWKNSSFFDEKQFPLPAKNQLLTTRLVHVGHFYC